MVWYGMPPVILKLFGSFSVAMVGVAMVEATMVEDIASEKCFGQKESPWYSPVQSSPVPPSWHNIARKHTFALKAISLFPRLQCKG